MTVTLNLPPETEAVLIAQAQAKGLAIEAYLEQCVATLAGRAGAAPPAKEFSAEQFDRDWDALSQGLEELPPLSDHALTREGMYSDHD